MVDDGPGGPRHLTNNPAQTGMGMDPASRPVGDGEVNLGRTGAQQDHVARSERWCRRLKPARRYIRQPASQIPQPQRIAGRQDSLPSDPLQRDREQADAINAGLHIAAMQTKWRANQPFGFMRQRSAGHADGEG